MNRWKTAFFALLIVTVIGLCAAAYRLLDAGVTQTYMEVGYTDAMNDLAVLAQLVPGIQRPLTRAEALTLLRRQHPSAFIVATDSSVTVGQLTFLFDRSGRLRSVVHPEVPKNR